MTFGGKLDAHFDAQLEHHLSEQERAEYEGITKLRARDEELAARVFKAMNLAGVPPGEQVDTETIREWLEVREELENLT